MFWAKQMAVDLKLSTVFVIMANQNNYTLFQLSADLFTNDLGDI